MSRRGRRNSFSAGESTYDSRDASAAQDFSATQFSRDGGSRSWMSDEEASFSVGGKARRPSPRSVSPSSGSSYSSDGSIDETAAPRRRSGGVDPKRARSAGAAPRRHKEYHARKSGSSKLKDGTVKKNKNTTSLSAYTKRILKQIYPNMSMTGEAAHVLDHWLYTFVGQAAKESELLLRSSASTVMRKDIYTVAKLILPNQLAKHGISKANQAIHSYEAASSGTRAKKISDSVKAKIEIGTGRIKRALKSHLGKKRRLAAQAIIYVSALVDYLAGELLEVAGTLASKDKRARIKGSDLERALARDEELGNIGGMKSAKSVTGSQYHLALQQQKIAKRKAAKGSRSGKKKAAPRKSTGARKSTKGKKK
jgi:histone H2B